MKEKRAHPKLANVQRKTPGEICTTVASNRFWGCHRRRQFLCGFRPPIVIIKPPDRLIGELCEFNWTKGDFIATRSSATTGRSVRHLSLAASR
jgi:hypothetical protein